jgi:glycolate oxidase iron-sulfur subunit
MLKEYPELFHDDAAWLERARHLAARCVDITEAVAQTKFEDASQQQLTARYGESIKLAYHAACHLAHAQKVRQAPDTLLHDAQATLGAQRLQLIPLREAEHCCGSAGIYNLINTELSMKVLARKMQFIADTGASVVVTTNPGCMLQLEAGARKHKMDIKVLHLAELLDCIYSANDQSAPQ